MATTFKWTERLPPGGFGWMTQDLHGPARSATPPSNGRKGRGASAMARADSSSCSATSTASISPASRRPLELRAGRLAR